MQQRAAETGKDPPRPQSLAGRAAQDLSFIRDAMEKASRFSAVPGLGWVLMGATALPAAWLAA